MVTRTDIPEAPGVRAVGGPGPGHPLNRILFIHPDQPATRREFAKEAKPLPRRLPQAVTALRNMLDNRRAVMSFPAVPWRQIA